MLNVILLEQRLGLISGYLTQLSELATLQVCALVDT